MNRKIKWFTVQVKYSGRVPFELFGELEKGALFMSAGGRLCGPGFSVSLDSQELAEAYLLALTARRRKTDPEFLAVAMQVSSSSEYCRSHIKQDSDKVREKLTRWGVEIPV